VDAKKKTGRDAAASDHDDDGEDADGDFGDDNFAADGDADLDSPINDGLGDAIVGTSPDARRVD
jgi:hypothetical protein